jgi:hypothetical protein
MAKSEKGPLLFYSETPDSMQNRPEFSMFLRFCDAPNRAPDKLRTSEPPTGIRLGIPVASTRSGVGWRPFGEIGACNGFDQIADRPSLHWLFGR